MGSDAERVIGDFRPRIENLEKRMIIAEHVIDKDFAHFRSEMQRICTELIATKDSVNGRLDTLLQKKTIDDINIPILQKEHKMLMEEHTQNKGAHRGRERLYAVIVLFLGAITLAEKVADLMK